MDTYHTLGGGYLRRALAMPIASGFVFMWSGILFGLFALDVAQKRGIKLKHLKSAMKFVWKYRKGIKYYLAFYKINFNPEEAFKIVQ